MPNQPKTPARAVRISDELWTAAGKKAAAEGTNITAVIRKGLEQYVADDES